MAADPVLSPPAVASPQLSCRAWCSLLVIWVASHCPCRGQPDVQPACGSLCIYVHQSRRARVTQTLLTDIAHDRFGKPSQTSGPSGQCFFYYQQPNFFPGLTLTQGRRFRRRNMQKQQRTSPWTQPGFRYSTKKLSWCNLCVCRWFLPALHQVVRPTWEQLLATPSLCPPLSQPNNLNCLVLTSGFSAYGLHSNVTKFS